MWASHLCLVLLLFLRGPAPAGPDATARPRQPNPTLLRADALRIEIIAPRHDPHYAAIARYAAYPVASLLGVRNISASQTATFPAGATAEQRMATISAFVDRPPRDGDIFVAVIPREYPLDTRGAYYGTWHGRPRNVILMREPLTVLPAPLARWLWSFVLTHELTHALHVPARPWHGWRAGHCTRPDCVLYPGLDVRSAWMTLRNLRRPRHACNWCADEVRAAMAEGP